MKIGYMIKPLNQNKMDKLPLDIAVIILEDFQEWRLGNVEEFTQTPEMITKSINTILNYLKLELHERNTEN